MLEVAVLIDHPLESLSGGLSRCWQNIAQAARAFPHDLHLDLHFLGRARQTQSLWDNVTYYTHPALLGTDRLFFLNNIPDQADLAPINPWLWRALDRNRCDLIHTTNTSLAFAKTGLRFARRRCIPLTNSIQTDMAGYTRFYTEKIVGRFLPPVLAEKIALKRQNSLLHKQERYTAQCRQIVAFRRGIDKQFFSPGKRDRTCLEKQWGIPPNTFVILFVGRVDEGKNILTLVEAARILLARKFPIHLLLVGKNSALKEKISGALGSAVTLAGSLPYTDLPGLYASSDCFVFPSCIEIFPNVVIEAKASGLPVLMHTDGQSEKVIPCPGQDGLVLNSNEPKAWAEQIAALIEQPQRRAALGEAARNHIEQSWPSWEEVLAQDILPVWKKCSANGF